MIKHLRKRRRPRTSLRNLIPPPLNNKDSSGKKKKQRHMRTVLMTLRRWISTPLILKAVSWT